MHLAVFRKQLDTSAAIREETGGKRQRLLLGIYAGEIDMCLLETKCQETLCTMP